MHLGPCSVKAERRSDSMTWVKICGITSLEDAIVAVEAGADALGFVFYEKSPRKVELETAKQIIAQLPEQVEKVGVFVDQLPEKIKQTVEQAGLTAIQVYQQASAKELSAFHGSIPAMNSDPPKIIFAVSGDQLADGGGIHTKSGFWGIEEGLKDILYALMLDCISAGEFGGTGRSFDWIKVRGMMPRLNRIRPTIVAGGLNDSNVATAIKILQPWGVDVSSGVEAKPGKKDSWKVRAFVEAVRRADKTL